MNAEFDLVLACLRWPQEAADGDRIRWLASKPIRWSYLLEILHHHKVVPLFLRNFETFAAGYMPDEPAAALRGWAMANANTAREQTAQLLRLHRLFREQQIALRIFKGIPLAIAAFQDSTLRDAGDIDLLVAEKDVLRASAILQGEGYLRCEPQARLTPRRLRSYFAHQKDFSYEHPGSGRLVDLHWRLFRNPYLPANAGLREVGEEWVMLGSEPIPTLPARQLLLYLCVHGALDGWLRLKWLADIAALVRTLSPEQLASTVEAATERQSLPQLSAAILLSRDMLGDDSIGNPLVESGCLNRADPRVAHILHFGKRVMTSNRGRPIREQIPSRQWFLNEFRLHTSARYRLDLLERSLFRPRVWTSIDLPDVLFPFYAVLSPLEWVSFRLKDRLGRLRRTGPQGMLQLAPADLALALEAACMLTFFRAALNFLPTRRLTAWMGKEGGQQPPISQAMAVQIIRRVEWAIEAVVRHAPLRFVCFPRSLAAYFMLRRRHIASRLFYGVAREGDQLKAHTWVKVGDRTVVGGEVESQFTVVNIFP